MKKLLTLTILLFAALALTACGDTATETDGGEGDTKATTAGFNDADVAFAQGMIPHHQQAVEMAELAADRAASGDVRQLAADIEAAQAPEIELLTTWLEEWGAEVPADGMDHGDMGHGDSGSALSGMMTEDDMTTLADAQGNEFDEAFVTMMVVHHEGAVQMARTQVAEGADEAAIEMAETIISTQGAEIAAMKRMLAG